MRLDSLNNEEVSGKGGKRSKNETSVFFSTFFFNYTTTIPFTTDQDEER